MCKQELSAAYYFISCNCFNGLKYKPKEQWLLVTFDKDSLTLSHLIPEYQGWSYPLWDLIPGYPGWNSLRYCGSAVVAIVFIFCYYDSWRSQLSFDTKFSIGCKIWIAPIAGFLTLCQLPFFKKIFFCNCHVYNKNLVDASAIAFS